MRASNLRYALRLIRLRPASSAAVVLTLALAIGANSTLFTLINAALFSPLPIRDIDRLVNVYTSGPDGTGYGGLSYPDFRDLRSAREVFSDAIGYSGLMATATGDAGSEMVFGELVTANYFSMLGVSPALGRGFEASEGEGGGAHAVVVIGDRLWRRRFGSAPDVVGRTLTLNGRPYTVVGVAPRDFPGLLFRAISSDVWVPVSMMGQLRTDERDNRAERWMFVKARLASDVTADRAAAATRVIASRLASAYPASNEGRTFPIVPTRDVVVHPKADAGIFAASAALMLSAALVLVVACANLAGVMLARGLARQREISIRLAIGARRSDIVGQLLVESLVLGIAGSAGGLLLARWVASGLAAWRPDLPIPVSLNTAVDVRVALFTFVVGIVATAAFALIPAFRSSRTAAAGSSAVIGARRRRGLFGLRDAMLVPQLAIALVLIATAALLARSLSRADAVNPGFDLDHTAFVSLFLEMSGYDESRARRFYETLEERLTARGTTTAVGVTGRLPLDIYGNRSVELSVDENPSIRHVVQTAPADDGYFRAMGIPVVRGRAFEARDLEPSSPSVALVSAAAARAYWGDDDPVGRQIRLGERAPASTVIGVAADVKIQTLGETPQPLVYQPLRTGYTGLLRLVARGGDSRAIVRDMRAIVRGIDPSVAVFEARTMTENLSVMLYPYRLAAGIGITFGLLAIALAGIGLYGVLACGVAERVRELAIRTALGATPASLVRSAAAETIRAAAVGLVIGALLTLAVGRLLAGYLFGISPADPLAIAATACALVAVVAVAGAGPVRRAIRVEPIRALRES